MALRKRKPTSAGRRFQTVSDFSEITKDRPEKSLLAPKPARPVAATPTAARPPATRVAATSASTASSTSSASRTACRPRWRPSSTTPTAPAASRCSTTTTARRRYILAPRGVKVGDRLQSGQGSDIRPGNALPLRYIPVGTTVHNVELRPGQGGKMARSAGFGRAARGQGRRLRHPAPARPPRCAACRSTAGPPWARSATPSTSSIKIGKAGRNRWKGVRPQTRGVAMNPVDHPMGGGEGKTSGGRHPVSPWGKPEGRTRDKNKPSQKLIVRRRRYRQGRR